MKKSKLDIAFSLLTKKKKPTPFIKLWEDISQIEGLTPSQQEDQIAQFYSDLCLDSRFVNMGENKWDLKSRHTFSETVIDTTEYLDDDNEEEEYDLEDVDEEEENNDKDEEKY
ncbi:MAG: DNA-directed RNA polymerase subunit delta [Traorella sp.]